MKISQEINFEIESIENDFIETQGGKLTFFKISPPNISILSEYEKLEKINSFKRFLKGMPADIPFSFFICDQTEDLRANKKFWSKAEEQYSFIGEDIINEIEKSNYSSNNGTQRGFYLIITTKDILQINKVENIIKQTEFNCKKLVKEEYISVLRSFFLRDFKEFSISTFEDESAEKFETLSKKQKRKTDKNSYLISQLTKLLLPTKSVIKYDCIEQSDFFRQVWRIKNMGLSFDELCLLKRVAQVKNTTLKISLSSMNKATAVSLVDKQMRDTDADRRSSSSATKKINADDENSNIRDFYKAYKKENDLMFYINIFIECYGKDKEDLSNTVAEVKSCIDEMSIELLNSDQDVGFKCISPTTPTDNLKVLANNIPSSSLAALYPFSYSTRTDKEGMFLGATDDGGYMFVDLLYRDDVVTNGNAFISGESGFGKSYLIKKIITQFLALPNKKKKRIFSFDHENEYSTLFKNLGGVSINALDATYMINPLQVRAFKRAEDDDIDTDAPEAFNQKSYLKQHLSWLKHFFSYTIPHLKGKDLDMMMSLVSDMYYMKGITDDTDFNSLKNSDYPIFTDLYNFIEKVLHNKKNYEFYKMYPDEIISGCLLMLKDLVDGSQSGLYNGYTNLPDNERINIDIQELSMGDPHVVQAYLFNMITYIWAKIILRDMSTMVVVDELYLLCNKNFPMAMEYLRNFIKRSRKYEAHIITATQKLGDVAIPELEQYTSALFNTPSYKFLFNPGDLDLASFKRLTKLSESKLDILQNCRKTQCLTFIGSSVYKLITGTLEFEKELFGAGGGR